MSGVFQNIDPPPPLHSANVSFPRTKAGGYTLSGRWGGGGRGINILEDARHWIGLLQYNLSMVAIPKFSFFKTSAAQHWHFVFTYNQLIVLDKLNTSSPHSLTIHPRMVTAANKSPNSRAKIKVSTSSLCLIGDYADNRVLKRDSFRRKIDFGNLLTLYQIMWG